MGQRRGSVRVEEGEGWLCRVDLQIWAMGGYAIMGSSQKRRYPRYNTHTAFTKSKRLASYCVAW